MSFLYSLVHTWPKSRAPDFKLPHYPNLKPEQAINYEAGLNWHPANNWRASFTVFSRHENDNIDYVRTNSTDIWRAMNFERLTFTGWEASLAWSLPNLQSIKLEYTGLRGAEAALKGYQSKYVFNYPTQQAVVGWQRSSSRGWLARARISVNNQYERSAYVLVDAYAAWTRSPFHPYARFTNVTNTDYQPVYGVVMPARAALAGIEWCVLGKPK